MSGISHHIGLVRHLLGSRHSISEAPNRMLRVMLVDDSQKDVSLLKESLTSAGYDVVEESTPVREPGRVVADQAQVARTLQRWRHREVQEHPSGTDGGPAKSHPQIQQPEPRPDVPEARGSAKRRTLSQKAPAALITTRARARKLRPLSESAARTTCSVPSRAMPKTGA